MIKKATRRIRTAGPAARISLEPDRSSVHADKKELAFVTVTILDRDGNMVPQASNLVKFTVDGPGRIKAVGNGDQVSHASFLAGERNAFNGKCLAIVEAAGTSGIITLTAVSEGLEPAHIEINIK